MSCSAPNQSEPSLAQTAVPFPTSSAGIGRPLPPVIGKRVIVRSATVVATNSRPSGETTYPDMNWGIPGTTPASVWSRAWDMVRFPPPATEVYRIVVPSGVMATCRCRPVLEPPSVGAGIARRDGGSTGPEARGRAQPQRAATAATANPTGQSRRARRAPRVAAMGRMRRIGVVPWPRSAEANSAALAKRSAGSLARAVRTASSTSSGTVSRMAEGGLGRSVITLATMACAVAPVKGGSPVSIS